MTHVCPFAGDAPAPSAMSSYCKPLSVVCIVSPFAFWPGVPVTHRSRCARCPRPRWMGPYHIPGGPGNDPAPTPRESAPSPSRPHPGAATKDTASHFARNLSASFSSPVHDVLRGTQFLRKAKKDEIEEIPSSLVRREHCARDVGTGGQGQSRPRPAQADGRRSRLLRPHARGGLRGDRHGAAPRRWRLSRLVRGEAAKESFQDVGFKTQDPRFKMDERALPTATRVH